MKGMRYERSHYSLQTSVFGECDGLIDGGENNNVRDVDKNRHPEEDNGKPLVVCDGFVELHNQLRVDGF